MTAAPVPDGEAPAAIAEAPAGPAGPDADGGPPGQGQLGQRGGNGQGGPGRGPGGPPSPQRLVEHAMRFDADGDGKLNRTELLNFAKDFVRHAPASKGDAAATAAPDKMDPASADLEVGAVTVAKAPAAVRPMTISRTVRSVRIVPSDATDTSDASRPAVLHQIRNHESFIAHVAAGRYRSCRPGRYHSECRGPPNACSIPIPACKRRLRRGRADRLHIGRRRGLRRVP